MMTTTEYLKTITSVFRPKRWYRNSFMLLGSALAIFLRAIPIQSAVIPIVLSFISLSFIASGNYGINEVCDIETDAHHPEKKFRALPSGRIKPSIVIICSIVLYALGFAITQSLHRPMVTYALLFYLLIIGIAYNIRPIRLKDYPYIDFISESLGNPARLAVGWYAVTQEIVPISFLLIFWCIGMLLMAGKRFAELRFLGTPQDAQFYRKSLGRYSQESLLLCMIAASQFITYLFGILSVKYEIDLVVMMPLIVVFLVWYFHLAHQPNSIAKDPERVFENKPFIIYVISLLCLFFLVIYFKFNYFSFLLRT